MAGPIDALAFHSVFGAYGRTQRHIELAINRVTAQSNKGGLATQTANRNADKLKQHVQRLSDRRDQLTAALFNLLFSQLSPSAPSFGSVLLRAQTTNNANPSRGTTLLPQANRYLHRGLYVTHPVKTASGAKLSNYV